PHHITTLSLHDALPISINEPQDHWADLSITQRARQLARQGVPMLQNSQVGIVDLEGNQMPADGVSQGEVVIRGNGVMASYYKNRSEEHTSELQSRFDLV